MMVPVLMRAIGAVTMPRPLGHMVVVVIVVMLVQRQRALRLGAEQRAIGGGGVPAMPDFSATTSRA